MNSVKWLISICRVVVRIAVILMIAIALFLSICYLGRQYEMTRVSRIYISNCTLYENIVSGNDDITYDRKENHYAVSKELLELGVDDIYSWKGNVFFEHKEKVLGMFPQGIVWVKQSDTLPEWMILSTISGQWYYYRIVS